MGLLRLAHVCAGGLDLGLGIDHEPDEQMARRVRRLMRWHRQFGRRYLLQPMWADVHVDAPGWRVAAYGSERPRVITGARFPENERADEEKKLRVTVGLSDKSRPREARVHTLEGERTRPVRVAGGRVVVELAPSEMFLVLLNDRR